MEYNLVIDADSILYTSCYRCQNVNLKDKEQFTDKEREESFDIEAAFNEFAEGVGELEEQMYKELGLSEDDEVIVEVVFSPKKTFRNELSKDYKANRKPTTIFGIGDLKAYVTERMDVTQDDNVEADDIVITRAYEKERVVIACIDKDIHTHSPVPCINYRTKEWIPSLSQEDIENNYWKQALMGDATDGIKGVKGIGKKKAEKIVDECNGYFNYILYKQYFDNDDDALMTMRLVRLDQYRDGKIELWTDESVPMISKKPVFRKRRKSNNKSPQKSQGFKNLT